MKTPSVPSMSVDQLAAEVQANQRRECLIGTRYILRRSVCELERVLGKEAHDAGVLILLAIVAIDKILQSGVAK